MTMNAFLKLTQKQTYMYMYVYMHKQINVYTLYV